MFFCIPFNPVCIFFIFLVIDYWPPPYRERKSPDNIWFFLLELKVRLREFWDKDDFKPKFRSDTALRKQTFVRVVKVCMAQLVTTIDAGISSQRRLISYQTINSQHEYSHCCCVLYNWPTILPNLHRSPAASRFPVSLSTSVSSSSLSPAQSCCHILQHPPLQSATQMLQYFQVKFAVLYLLFSTALLYFHRRK